nr:hypothetical protein [uncultured Methanobrevibacter sp.]
MSPKNTHEKIEKIEKRQPNQLPCQKILSCDNNSSDTNYYTYTYQNIH